MLQHLRKMLQDQADTFSKRKKPLTAVVRKEKKQIDGKEVEVDRQLSDEDFLYLQENSIKLQNFLRLTFSKKVCAPMNRLMQANMR